MIDELSIRKEEDLYITSFPFSQTCDLQKLFANCLAPLVVHVRMLSIEG